MGQVAVERRLQSSRNPDRTPSLRWLILGAGGQLGSAMREVILMMRPSDGLDCPTRAELDVTEAEQTRQYVLDYRPDALINCAAWTDVDGAESNPVAAYKINALAPLTLAETMRQQGHGVLVQVSTDYVFDGTKQAPYEERDIPSPLSVYARTKLIGESVTRVLPQRAIVARTAWLYSSSQANFVQWVRNALATGKSLEVVSDQYGHPTFAADAALRVYHLARLAGEREIQPARIFHAVNSGVASRFELAREVARLTGYDSDQVVPVKSAQVPWRAIRPAMVSLGDANAAAWDAGEMRPWKEALRDFLGRC